LAKLIKGYRGGPLVRWAAVMIWMGFIFYLSAQSTLPQLADRWGVLQSSAGHFAEYAILALLLRWGLVGGGVGHPSRWACMIAAAYAITDEFHQRLVPGRHMDPLDLLTDVTGAVVVLLAVELVILRRGTQRSKGREPYDMS
jgi:hypothetical protein